MLLPFVLGVVVSTEVGPLLQGVQKETHIVEDGEPRRIGVHVAP